MKISVALATYNGEKYIGVQLNSLLTQIRLPDQLVISDDASNDATLDIAENFKRTAPFEVIIYSNTRNIGHAQNFQNAVEECTGDVIAFCDQDDFWKETKLSKIETAFEADRCLHYIISNAELVDQNLNDTGKTLWDKRGFNTSCQVAFLQGKQFYHIVKHNISTGMVTAVRKGAVSKAGPIPSGVSHDMWYIPLMAVLGLPGNIIDDCLVKYRQHSSQLYGVQAQSSCIGNKLRRLRERNTSELIKKIAYYDALLSRASHLMESENVSRKVKNNIDYLQGRLEHLILRDGLGQSSLINKMATISRDTINGNYHEHSNGFISAASDVFAREKK